MSIIRWPGGELPDIEFNVEGDEGFRVLAMATVRRLVKTIARREPTTAGFLAALRDAYSPLGNVEIESSMRSRRLLVVIRRPPT